MSSLQMFRIHRLPLTHLHEKYGKLPTAQLVSFVVNDINSKQINEFNIVGCNYPRENQFGFRATIYSQKEQILDTFMETLKVRRFKTVYNDIVFYEKPGYLFALTFGSYWKLLKDVTSVKFPDQMQKTFKKKKNEKWTTIPPASPFYDLNGIVNAPDMDVKLAFEKTAVRLNLGDKYDFGNAAEMLNFFVEHCELQKD